MILFYAGDQGLVVYPGAWRVKPFSDAGGTHYKTVDSFANVVAWLARSLPAGSLKSGSVAGNIAIFTFPLEQAPDYADDRTSQGRYDDRRQLRLRGARAIK